MNVWFVVKLQLLGGTMGEFYLFHFNITVSELICWELCSITCIYCELEEEFE